MKVYVMSKDALGTLRQFFNTHHQSGPYADTVTLEDVREAVASMREQEAMW